MRWRGTWQFGQYPPVGYLMIITYPLAGYLSKPADPLGGVPH